MSTEGNTRRVGQGECVASIAADAGHLWQTVWNAPENNELRARRKDPNVLKADDEIFVPALRRRSEAGGSESRHRFVRKGTPSRVRVRLMNLGEPRRNEPFGVEVDGIVIEGQTDRRGWLEIVVPPQAQGGVLRLGEAPDFEEFELAFGVR